MREHDILEEKFSKIDEYYDILLTHDPVFNLGDTDVVLQPKYESQRDFEHIGNKELFNQFIKLYDKGIQPKFTLCGHIHSGEHKPMIHWGTIAANVSLMDEYCNKLVYEPLLIDWTKTAAGEIINFN